LIINQLRFFHHLIFPTFSPHMKNNSDILKYLQVHTATYVLFNTIV